MNQKRCLSIGSCVCTKHADKRDVPILCSAIRAGCDHLVTSDKQDFGHLYGQRVQGVLIITLLQLAHLLIDRPG